MVASRANGQGICARASFLLLGFLVALLVGVFGHPSSGLHHLCEGDQAHLADQPEHAHDGSDCAGCHLFQTLQHSDVPTVSAMLGCAQGGVRAVAEPAGAPRDATWVAFEARGPPAA